MGIDINRLITRIIECLYAIHAEDTVSKHIHWEYVSSLHSLATYLIRILNLWQTAKVVSKYRHSNTMDRFSRIFLIFSSPPFPHPPFPIQWQRKPRGSGGTD